MKMKDENLNFLVFLMDSVINSKGKVKQKITDTSYMSNYLKIFMDEVDNHNGEPVHVDNFTADLWNILKQDPNQFKKEANDFYDTWNAWFHFYNYLNRQNLINKKG